jgi:hypothetical protein
MLNWHESMSIVEVIIRLNTVAVLVSCLCIKHRQRVRSRCQSRVAGQQTGRGIDVAALKPRIEALRHDYLAAQQPKKGRCYHRALLEIAGRAVAQLGYFRARKEKDQPHTQGYGEQTR